MNYEIVSTRGPMKGRRWILTPQGVKIGRADSCEIQVTDVAAELFHCVVKLVDGKPTVLNLASDCGVDVNGTNVDEAELDPNDTIRIGNERFIVLSSGRKKGGPIAGKIMPLAILLGIAAVGAYFYRQYNGRAERDKAAQPAPVVPAVKPSDDSVTTNRIVRMVAEEIVKTNRVVHIVDNVVVTNYVVEVGRGDELVSSMNMSPTDESKLEGAKHATMTTPDNSAVNDNASRMPVEKLPPYEVIDSKKVLAMGGATGGDEVRMVVNTNGTCDIIHIFTETEVTKTLVVPKNNRIISNSGKFLVVGGGGTSSTWDGRGGGGAGGVVFRKNVNVVPGTAYVYVGSGGERYGWHGRNGDDSILTLCGKTYVAIGGGAGGGFSGGSGGGGQSITGQIGKGLQTKSASGGIGHDGFGDKGEIRCGGGGAAAQSSISGDLVMYAKGGVDEVCSPAEATGAASTGSGASFGGWDGPSFFKLPGGSGIVVLRYAVKRPVSRLPVSNIPPEFPGQDRNVRTKWVSGIEWRYFVGKDGSATIGSHAEAGFGHPDLWQPAVDINALSGVVKIPDRIDGRPVRRIGKGAFQGCMRVTKFVVPDGVTHCGPRAFARCSSLEVVEYPGSIQWLGDGQVYNSQKIKYLRFQSAPPQCDYGRCPFKGTSGEGVCLVVPFALQSGWQNRSRWMNDQDQAVYRCNDGCHLCSLQNIPSDEDMKEATRNNAGFVSMQFKWKSLEELKSSHIDIEKDSNVIKKWQNWLGLQVETVWRNFERIADRRVLSPCFDNPEMTATIFVGMMHFRAFEPVYFRHRIDNYGMIMVDDKIALEFDVESSHDRTVSSKDPIVFPVDGWHRLAIISANGMRESGGWANYKRGEKGKWRNFEANPDGAEFRVTKEDSLRAVADIERAKHK